MVTQEYRSPCGSLLLGVEGENLCLCDWMTEGRIEKTLGRIKRHMPVQEVADNRELLHRAQLQLDEYFEGERKEFELSLMPFGTSFQQQVWKALLEVPYGVTSTYAEIAVSIGRGSSVRGVANAIGANPLSVFIPCHRIIGSDGSLCGYAGGLPAKRLLLALEQKSLLQA